jgi:hypothetical protein
MVLASLCAAAELAFQEIFQFYLWASSGKDVSGQSIERMPKCAVFPEHQREV